MSILTIQPSTADAYLSQGNPTNNYGNATYLLIRASSGNDFRPIFSFDFSAIPANAIITAAPFSLYNYSPDTAGRTYGAYRVTRITWTQNGVCWSYYSGISSWTTAGGDFTATNSVSAMIPASPDWMAWDVKAMIGDIYPGATILHVLIKDDSAPNSSTSQFYSNNYTIDPTLCPKLALTYTLGPSKISGVSVPTKVNNLTSPTKVMGL